MEPQVLDEATIKQLTDTFVAEMQKSLDKRDSDLMEKVAKARDTKIDEIIAEERRKNAQFIVPGLGPKETKAFSFAKLLKGMISRDFSDCAFEVDLCKEAAKAKDMAAGTDSAGGFIVPAQVMQNEMVPLLKAAAIAPQLGATMWTGLNGSPVQIPKKTAASTAYWVGEAPSTGVTTSDVGFGQLEMRPHTCAARTRVSNRLIMLSSPAVEPIIRQDLMEQAALAVDLAYFNGSGVSNQPKGILQTTGINTVTSFGGAAAATAYNKLLAMQYELAVDNALKGTLGWAMHPAVLFAFQQMVDATDQPKQRRLFAEKPIGTTLVNYPYATSTQLPTNDILFGNFADAGIGVWSSMGIRVSDVAGTAFENLQTQILLAMDVDVCVRQPVSFCSTTGMTGAP